MLRHQRSVSCWALALLLATTAGAAQGQGSFNMTLVGSQDLHPGYNDIWGFTATNPGYPFLIGNEYALLGTVTGTSVVDVTNPATPIETGFFPGPNSTWRDIKTYDDFAYVVTEGGGGMQILDLTDASNPVLNGTFMAFSSAHNIYIEVATARAYACGTNTNNGGVVVMDISSPTSPVVIGNWTASYVHDLYVEDNIAYLAEINAATLSVVDFSNPASPFLIGGPISYPGSFTHNTWTTMGSDYVLTTDENSGGHLRVWDIQNLPTITQVAEYKAPETNSIIHNVIVRDHLAYISYYTEGTRIVDVSDPEVPVEVAWYDNFVGPSGGFDGVWGVYPFLPSGRVLSSDMSEGLLVFEVQDNWGRVGGVVTELGVGTPLSGVTVELVEAAASFATAVPGKYGLVSTPGTYTLRASKEGFFDHEEEVTLTQGVPLALDISLERRPFGALTGTITGQTLNKAIINLEDAKVEILGTSQVLVTDNSGGLSFPQVPVGSYLLRVTRAAFGRKEIPFTMDEGGRLLDVALLESPWYDNADTPNGWSFATAGDDAVTGIWQQAVPVPSGGGNVAPGVDASPGTTLGVCFVTENAGDPQDSIGAADIDGGTTTLTSPIVDLTGFAEPQVAYSRWYVNEAGSNPGTDIFTVQMSDDNGASWTTVETLTNDATPWTRVVFRVQDHVARTDQFRIRFLAADAFPGSLVEAAIDDLEFFDLNVTAAPATPPLLSILGSIAPNPFNPRTTVYFQLGAYGFADLGIYDLRGRRVATLVAEPLAAGHHSRVWSGVDRDGRSVASGVYLVVLEANGTRSSRKLTLAK